uniref:Uncharacterized protein n=1 Tax=Anguilla anguilla TaxID=7936 RepID=A0A0E9XRN4_ANGAN
MLHFLLLLQSKILVGELDQKSTL